MANTKREERKNIKEPVLKVEGLRKTYDSFNAIKNISFEIYPGEIVGLLGPNGAGKTTIMKILSTMLSETEGKFSVCGLTNKEKDKIKSLTGVFPDKTGLPKVFNGKEYLTYLGQLYGLTKKEATKKSTRTTFVSRTREGRGKNSFKL